MNDRHSCPHCGRQLNPRPYLMARNANTPVLSTQLICWVIVAAIVLILVTLHAG